MCEVHPDRVKHFYDHNTKTLCCRACIEDKQALGIQVSVTDLYEVDPAAVKNLFASISNNHPTLNHNAVPEYYDDEVEIGDDKMSNSF
jgi:hypothetical protein